MRMPLVLSLLATSAFAGAAPEVQQSRLLKGHTGGVYSIAYSPAGDILVSGSADKTVRLWPLIERPLPREEQRRRRQLMQDLDADLFDVRQQAFLQLASLAHEVEDDLKRLLRDTQSAEVRLRVRQLLIQIKVPPGVGHQGDIRSVAFAPDGKTVASASRDNHIRIWNAGSGRTLRTIKAHGDGTWAVAFSPDGGLLASGGGDHLIRLWDVSWGQVVLRLEGHGSTVHRVAFSPDGKTLASAGGFDKTARLWDVDTGEPRAVLQGHTDAVLCVAFAPDGKMVASSGYDGTVNLWRTADGKHASAIHTDRGVVRCVAFSPKGALLAAGGDDRVVRLWNSDTGDLETVLKSHGDTIHSIAFSPDGSRLATAGRDGLIRITPIRPLLGSTSEDR